MPSRKPHLCIFGDSHYAAVRSAYANGLVDTTGIEIEFWGNTGNRIRELHWNNDQIEPMDDFTARRFAKFNEKGRKTLSARDFDMVLFVGCRLRVSHLFPEFLHRLRTPAQALSSGIMSRVISDFLRVTPTYQFAANFAAQKKARIVFAPLFFEIDEAPNVIPDHFHAAANADKNDRKIIWDMIDKVMTEDGITLIRQDESTVVNGCYTDLAFAIENYEKKPDYHHKNDKFGALILKEAIEIFKKQPKRKIQTVKKQKR